jgi:cation diffusion facilitator family transporter
MSAAAGHAHGGPGQRHSEAGHSHGRHDHGHSHGGVDAAIVRSREAMRTLGLSLAVLGATAALQLVVVVLSGSVALLADTVHNLGDALTALPLGAAFMLGRRPPSRRFPYGLGRTEDLAGIAVVLIILFSSGYAAFEAIERLVNPREPGYLLATALAGLVGFAGNEWVAVFRIRSGRRLGSAALEADGHHARVDGFTSLAVVAGAAGVALGFQPADPIVGLAISAVILRIVWRAGREIVTRALDGVDPHLLEHIEADARAVAGVRAVEHVQARWLGHAIRAELAIAVDPDVTMTEAQEVAERVRRGLLDAHPLMADAIVRATVRA